MSSLGGVDLNLLLALDALLTERNVTHAANRMSLGQSAMSAALARLRKQLEDPLLVREGRSYVLTTFAESLVVPVREAVAAVDAVLTVRKQFDPGAAERTFTVIASDYAMLVLMRPLLAELATEAPGVHITVNATGHDFDSRLRRGSADLLICPTELAEDLGELPSAALFEDRFVLVADRDNPDVDDDIDVERLSALSFVGVGGLVPAVIGTQLEASGVHPRIGASTQTHVVIPFLLAGTRMVSFVQERLVHAVSEQARLRLVRSPIELRPLVQAMYWTARNSEDPAHRWLRSRLVDQARRI